MVIKPIQGLRSRGQSATPGCTGGYSYIATFVAMIVKKRTFNINIELKKHSLTALHLMMSMIYE
jgi:glutamate formiminotransferase